MSAGRILVVDDDKEMCALLEAGLDSGGGAAFADGVGDLLLISAAMSLIGAVAAALLVHQRDLWAPAR